MLLMKLSRRILIQPNKISAYGTLLLENRMKFSSESTLKLKLVDPKIKLVTLDALNTLFRLQKSPGEIYADFAQKHGIKCDGNSLNTSFRLNFKKLSKEKPCYGYGKDGEMDWWLTLVKRCFIENGLERSRIDAIARELVDFFGTREPWALVDENVSAHIKEIKRRNIHLAIISNFDSRLRTILYNFQLAPYIELVLASGEIGIEKPDKRIFEMAAKHFRLKSMDEMLHVGDNEEQDLLGARNAGARAVLLNSSKVISTSNDSITFLKEILY